MPSIPPRLERSLKGADKERLIAALYHPMAHPIHLMLRWDFYTAPDALEERNIYLRDAGFDVRDDEISEELADCAEVHTPYLAGWDSQAEERAAKDGRYQEYLDYRETGDWPELWKTEWRGR